VDGLSRSLEVQTTILGPDSLELTDTSDLAWGSSAIGLQRLAGVNVNSDPLYALTQTDSQRRPLNETFGSHLSSSSKWKADRLAFTGSILGGGGGRDWVDTTLRYSPNGQLVGSDWRVTTNSDNDYPLAAESIARTVDGRAAMHQWAWSGPSGADALADLSETRGFAYDARGFLIRDHRIIGHPGAIASALPDFADVYHPGEGATRIADLDASTLTTINDGSMARRSAWSARSSRRGQLRR
jgi:hypothetical protein